MIITGLDKYHAQRLHEVVFGNWHDYIDRYRNPIDGSYNISIGATVPVIVKYYAGDDANDAYVSIWCGDKVCSLNYCDYNYITL